MRSETLVLASLLLCGSSTTLAAPSFDHSKSFQPRWDQDNYVRAEGLKLMNQDKEYFVAGMNYYGCMNLAADDSAGGNLSRAESELKQMADFGVNTVRIMAASEGAPTVQPYRMYPALLESPYHWNEDIFVGLDRCIAKMGDLGQKGILALADTWHWSGGFGQYVSWTYGNNESIPYPPSWDPNLNPPFGDYGSNGTWEDYRLYALGFYVIPEAQQLYRAHIDKVINRVNTVTGIRYGDDPTVLAWELANEPITPAPYEWFDNTAAYIHGQSKQMVTTGFQGEQGEEWWKFVHKSDHIDFGCAHWWPQNQGIYDALNSSEANLKLATDSIQEYLTNVSRWTTDLGKPTILEETGFPRDEWVAVENGAPNSTYLFDSENPVEHRNAYFKVGLDMVVDLYEKSEGIVGYMPWTYGGSWRPTDSRNQFNEIWAGDPPHEAPGWYDVYDTDDSTISILSSGFKKAFAFGQ